MDFEPRALAWGIKRGVAKDIDSLSDLLHDNFTYRSDCYDFLKNEDVQRAYDDMKVGEKPDIIFVDTLSKNLVGDSDKNDVMSNFLINMEKLRQATGATIVVIHHTGWSNQDRERGGYSLRAGVDTSVLVRKNGESGSTVICKKQKMGRDFPTFDVIFDLVELDEISTSDEQITGLVGRCGLIDQEYEDLKKLVRSILSEHKEMNQSELVKCIQDKAPKRIGKQKAIDHIDRMVVDVEIHQKSGDNNSKIYEKLGFPEDIS